MTGRAAGEAERRRRARARKAEAAPPVAVPRLCGPELEWLPDGTLLDDCPDPANHMACLASGGKHDWYKPHPRPRDHKYECEDCGHYDLDDYK